MFSQLIQHNVGPAGYHKDHLDKETYLQDQKYKAVSSGLDDDPVDQVYIVVCRVVDTMNFW